MQLDLANFLVITAIVLSSFIGLMLIAVPCAGRNENRLLACFVLIISLLLIDGFLISAGFYHHYPAFAHLISPLAFALGPVLWIYTKTKTRGPHSLARNEWLLHLLPMGLIFFNYSPYYTSPIEHKSQLLTEPLTFISSLNHHYWLYLHLSIYCGFALWEITRYNRQLENNLSNVSDLQLKWLRLMCYGVFCIISADLLLGEAAQALGLNWQNIHSLVVFLTIIFIVGMTLFAIKQPATVIASLVVEAKPKYQNSGLSTERMDYFISKIHELVNSRHLYLDNDISLAVLAQEINLTPHHLSQILNERLNKSFYEYINELRIEYAKNVLRSSSKAVVDIAIEAGFNNKASFYNAFRKNVGETPTSWRQNH